MNRLPFGTRVHVTAVVEPRYLSWQTARPIYHPYRQSLTAPVDPFVLTVNDDAHETLGGPLPHTTAVPTSGLHRRLRRFGREASGVVVGWVWRAEGHYHEASYHFEDDQDRAYLDESGRHRLYQVALDPGEVGRRFVPADIVLVHPDNLEVRP